MAAACPLARFPTARMAAIWSGTPFATRICADDIVSELGPLVTHFVQTPESTNATETRETAVDEDYKILLEAIDHTPLTADEIAGRSGLTIDQVSSMLLILELEGKIEAQVGGRYSRPH